MINRRASSLCRAVLCSGGSAGGQYSWYLVVDPRSHDSSEPSKTSWKRWYSQDQKATSATELAGLAVPSSEEHEDAHGPLAAYESLISSGHLRQDARQECTVKELERLYRDLIARQTHVSKSVSSGLTLIDASEERGQKSSWWQSMFQSPQDSGSLHSQEKSSIKGLYMYGGVGCGKTMLMDMFASSVPRDLKVRKSSSCAMVCLLLLSSLS